MENTMIILGIIAVPSLIITFFIDHFKLIKDNDFSAKLFALTMFTNFVFLASVFTFLIVECNAIELIVNHHTNK